MWGDPVPPATATNGPVQTGEIATPGLPPKESSARIVHRIRVRAHPWDWYGERLSDPVAFFLPIALFPVPAVLIFLDSFNWLAVWKMLGLLATTLAALDGAILLGFILGFAPWVTVAATLWVELLLLLWLLRNLEFLRRWPRARRFLERREARAIDLYSRRRWMQRFHFWGVVLFTFLPLNSGVFMGVFVGKITGMPTRRLFTAVFFGITLWAIFVAWAVSSAQPFIEKLLE